jgi:hypothetical protein
MASCQPLTKKARFGSRSVTQWYGSTDPDPCQNVKGIHNTACSRDGKLVYAESKQIYQSTLKVSTSDSGMRLDQQETDKRATYQPDIF